jgi:Uma2 family endonuclease
MSNQSLKSVLTVEEYLHYEELSDIRHEYIQGQVYAMSGGSREHDLISGNIYMALRIHLDGGRCQVFSANMKVKINRLDLFYYPDVSVTCNPQDQEKYFLESPCLIVEVLSPSTERIDRQEKLINYRELKSLQEYVLVSQTEKKVEVYRRGDRSEWNLETFDQDDIVELQSVGLQLPLSEIYKQVAM